MSWLAMVAMAASTLCVFECVGRLGGMHSGTHRLGVRLWYAGAACVCILAASCTWQGVDAPALDLLAAGVALQLAVTWADWRGGPPDSARRWGDLTGMEPSRIPLDRQ